VALLRGYVDIAVAPLAAVSPLLQQNDVKALAVTGANRSFAFRLPAIGEAGPGGYDLSVWFAIAAPPGRRARLSKQIMAAAQQRAGASWRHRCGSLATGAEIRNITPRN